MATTTRVLSSIGTVQHYGPRQANDGLPAAHSTYGVVKQMVVPFDYDDLPLGAIDADDDAANLAIPAHSMIRHAFLEVNEAFVGGTSITMGFEDTDGTTDDVDALVTAAQAATANLTDGAWLVGAGAKASNDTVGVENVSIVAAATGTYTAGSGRLVIEYIEPTGANAIGVVAL